MTTRRELLIGAASLALVPACNGGSTTSMSDAASGPSCASTISANHGHVLSVPGADLAATRDHTYDIHGAADHTHSVTITQAELSTLAGGGVVSVMSTLSGGHAHTCMVHCTT
jgi:hypothetical protein